MQFRHELKHEINLGDMMAIRARMRAICEPDPHATSGKYFIRSLYFDTTKDRALREKLAGVRDREKFRIRFYNKDPSLIHLEKKVKRNSLGYKLSASLTQDEALAIADGDLEWAKNDARPLLRELYEKALCEGLKAKTVVDYTREPFIFRAGNVRVTLDYDIRTGLYSKDFLNRDLPTLPLDGNPIIMEVKWDAYLPSIIKDAVQLDGRRTASFSKYAACRAFD